MAVGGGDADANGVFSGKEAVIWHAIQYHTMAHHTIPKRSKPCQSTPYHTLSCGLYLQPYVTLLCGSSLALIAANEEVLISIVIANIVKLYSQ